MLRHHKFEHKKENLRPSSEQKEIVSAQVVDQGELQGIPRIVKCGDKDDLGRSMKFEKREGGESPGDKVRESQSEVAKVHNANSSESVKLVILVAQPILAQNNITPRVNLQCVSGVQNQAAVGKSVDVPLKRIVSDQTKGEQNYVASREKLQYWYTVQNQLIASESDDIPPNTAREQAIGKEEDPGKMPPHADDLQVQSSADKCSTRENQNKYHHSPDDESQSQVCGDTAPSDASISCFTLDPPSNIDKSSAVQEEEQDTEMLHVVEVKEEMLDDGSNQQESCGGQIQWQSFEATFQNEDIYNGTSCENPGPFLNKRAEESRKEERGADETEDQEEERHPVLLEDMLGRRLQRQYKNPLTFQCKYCPKKFSTGKIAKNHEQMGHTNSGQHKCEYCPQTFVHRHHLGRHLRTHTKDRPFKCAECPRSFASARALVNHQPEHRGERPFRCDICDKGFRIRSLMTNHKRRTHPTSPKSFKCPFCDKTFLEKNNLDRHEQRHKGIRPFLCTTCGKAFGTNFVLQRHMRLHTGERPFKCLVCDISFTHNSVLAEHMFSHKEFNSAKKPRGRRSKVQEIS